MYIHVHPRGKEGWENVSHDRLYAMFDREMAKRATLLPYSHEGVDGPVSDASKYMGRRLER